MREPSILAYASLVMFCLVMASVAMYLLVNFNRILIGRIRHELLRKNIVAWMIIFCINTAMAPMNGGFFYQLYKYGFFWTMIFQVLTATICTGVGYNIVRLVAENKKLQQLSFLKHKLLIFGVTILTALAINLPLTYIMYSYNTDYLKYSVMSTVYIGGAVGLIYGVTSYQELERKRKFDEKELELSRLRELKSKAELDALHSKVNPHFLYNALNSIADLSITDGKKARRMTIALADLFRYSINYTQKNYSTVNEEVAMTEVYLQIEKIRFEDQLNYTVHVKNDAGHYLVPRFILQPLIENAVKHGLKITGTMTEITLDVAINEKGLIISIADNGPAFPDELSPGYGVKSVFDKLDLLFPEQYEIFFSNHPVKQVAIHIYKLMKNEPVV